MTPAEAARHLEDDGYGTEAARAVTARDPEDVDLPGIFVDRVVEVGKQETGIENRTVSN